MLGSDALSGAAGDASCDDAGASQGVADGFWSEGRKLAAAFGFARPIPVRVWCHDGSFEVVFGDMAGPQTNLWLSAEGIDGLIGELQAMKARTS